MGVSYSSTLGFGFVFTHDTFPAAIKQRYDKGDDNDVVAFLTENGIDTDIIGFSVDGNAMASDGAAYLFYLKTVGVKYIDSMEYDDNEMIFSFDNPILSPQEYEEFKRLSVLLFDHVYHKIPCWHLIQNVG